MTPYPQFFHPVFHPESFDFICLKSVFPFIKITITNEVLKWNAL